MLVGRRPVWWLVGGWQVGWPTSFRSVNGPTPRSQHQLGYGLIEWLIARKGSQNLEGFAEMEREPPIWSADYCVRLAQVVEAHEHERVGGEQQCPEAIL